MQHPHCSSLLMAAMLLLPLASECVLYTPKEDGKDRQETIIQVFERAFAFKQLSIDQLQDKASKLADDTLFGPFAFYRGNAALFYNDIHDHNILTKSPFYNEEARVWIQGDMHLMNMGTFSDNTGSVIFDVNDFDESYPANFLYDVYRLATSIVLVSRSSSQLKEAAEPLVRAFASAYITQVQQFHGNKDESDFQCSLDNNAPLKATSLIKVLIDKVTEDGTQKAMLDKWTKVDKKDGRVFDIKGSKGDLETIKSKRYDAIHDAFDDYRKTLTDKQFASDDDYFKILDIAKRLNAGLGSFGLERYYVLIQGGSKGKDAKDARILDIKLQGTPSIEQYLEHADQVDLAEAFDNNNAFRVVMGQQACLNTDRVDKHLGYIKLQLHGEESYFSVRERSPTKSGLDKVDKSFTTVGTTSKYSFADFKDVVEQYGKILAADHARGDNDTPFNVVRGIITTSFEDVLSKHIKENSLTTKQFEDDVLEFATSYASQVKSDRDLFLHYTKPIVEGIGHTEL